MILLGVDHHLLTRLSLNADSLRLLSLLLGLGLLLRLLGNLRGLVGLWLLNVDLVRLRLLNHHRIDLDLLSFQTILLLSLLGSPGCILLLPLLLLFVLLDALSDVVLELSAEIDWQLSEFKSHLVVVVFLNKLSDNLDDALRLGGIEVVDLSDQIVSFLDSEWLIFDWSSSGLSWLG